MSITSPLSKAWRGSSPKASLSISPFQNIAEFWCVATRPIANNGLGFSPAATLAEVNKIERVLTMLPDSPLAYEEWKRLVLQHGITGVRVHDARLVALMNVHRVRRILTETISPHTAWR